MFRNNDSAGLGNGNSGQRGSLWNVVSVSGGGNLVRGVCLLSACVSAAIHSSALHSVKLGLGLCKPYFPFASWILLGALTGAEGNTRGREKGLLIPVCFLLILFLFYGLYLSSSCWFQFPEFFLHSQNPHMALILALCIPFCKLLGP